MRVRGGEEQKVHKIQYHARLQLTGELPSTGWPGSH